MTTLKRLLTAVLISTIGPVRRSRRSVQSRVRLLFVASAILLTAPVAFATTAALTAVSFDGSNGIYPYSSLTLGSDGNFYGATGYGRIYNEGTAYQLTPSGALTTLLIFDAPRLDLPVESTIRQST